MGKDLARRLEGHFLMCQRCGKHHVAPTKSGRCECGDGIFSVQLLTTVPVVSSILFLCYEAR